MAAIDPVTYPHPQPCTPFTNPTDHPWYTAAELNENCCEQPSLCCRVNADGHKVVAPFFRLGAGPAGSPTLTQARAFCGSDDIPGPGSGPGPGPRPGPGPGTGNGPGTEDSPVMKTIWMIIAGVLVLVLLLLVYLYFAKSKKTASALKLRPAPRMARETSRSGRMIGEPNPFL